MSKTTATSALIERMLSFDGAFDGYPSMWCSDEALIWDALEENSKNTSPIEGVFNHGDGVVLMSYLASVHVTTREQYYNCRNFIDDFVAACWAANMGEGSNPVYEEISEEESA